MGSFNTTCFVSNQTIAPGDPCRLIPIVRTKDFQPVQLLVKGEPASAYGATSSNCYANAFWAPLGSCIAAVYADYGQFTLSMSPKTALQVLGFFKTALETFPVALQGENECHDVPFDFRAYLAEKAPLLQALLAEPTVPSPLDETPALFEEIEAAWDYIWEVAREQRLFQVQRDVISPVQFAVVHEAAFNALSSTAAQDSDWDGASMSPQDWAVRTLQGAISCCNDCIGGEDLKNELVRESVGLYSFSSYIREALRSLRTNNLSIDRSTVRVIDALARQHLKGTLTPDKFWEALGPLLEDDYFYRGLEELGPRLSPMVYCGQDYSNEVGQAYARFVANVSREVTRGRKRHYGDPLFPYTVRLPDEAEVEKLADAIGEWDAEVDNVRCCRCRIERADGEVESFVEASLEASLGPKEFADCFTEFLDEHELEGSILS